MRYKNLFVALVISLFIVSAAIGADKYQIDPAHTSIGFSVKHLVISLSLIHI